MGRSESLIKRGDSSFSPKYTLGIASSQLRIGGRATELEWGAYPAAHPNQTPNTGATISGDSPRGISFTVERETTQTVC